MLGAARLRRANKFRAPEFDKVSDEASDKESRECCLRLTPHPNPLSLEGRGNRQSARLRKLQFGRGCFIIQTARRFAGDRRDVFDGDLASASFWTLHLDFGGVAGLLIDLLIGSGLVTNIEFGRGVGFEEQDTRLFGDAEVFLVEDGAAESK